MYYYQCGTSGCNHAQMGMIGAGGLLSHQQVQSQYYDALKGMVNMQSRAIDQQIKEETKPNKKLLLLRK